MLSLKPYAFIGMIIGSLVILYILYHLTPDYSNKVSETEIIKMEIKRYGQSTKKNNSITELDFSQIESALNDVPKDFSYLQCIKKKIPFSNKPAVGLPVNPKECEKLHKFGKVRVGVSWGLLNGKQRKRWARLKCDQYIRLLHCKDIDLSNNAEKKKWLKLGCDLAIESKESLTIQSLPESSVNALILSATEIIAVTVASTTRGMGNPTVASMSLFTLFLPSLLHSLELNFEYRIYIGYDIGDAWWDAQDRNAYLPTMQSMVSNARQCGIRLSFHLVRCENKVKKPGPVFNCMLKKAYDDGANYFARWNDDSQIMHTWATKFRNFLISLGPPFGAAGPWCNEGNQDILTHDFVHRTHMDIFEGLYYPPILSDWWMDDWITLVYGRNRTKRFYDVHIQHHLGEHGTRYGVDYAHQKELKIEIDKGRLKIAQWAKKKQLFDVEKEFQMPFEHYNMRNGIRL